MIATGKYIILLIPLITSLGFATAQNFEPVKEKGTYYFDYNGYTYNSRLGRSFFLASRIDSVSGTDSVKEFFNYRQLIQNDFFYFSHASWLGEKVLWDPKGFYFLTRRHDSFFIRSSPAINEKWLAFKRKNMNYFLTVTGYSIDTFFGVTDSVLTMEFSVYKDTQAVQDRWTGKKLKISKNYGFLTTLNFFHFPEDLYSIRLIGGSMFKNGYKQVTAYDIFNYPLGSIFHIANLYEERNYEKNDSFIRNNLLEKEIIGKEWDDIKQEFTYRKKVLHVSINKKYGEEKKISWEEKESSSRISLAEFRFLELLPFEPFIKQGEVEFVLHFPEREFCGSVKILKFGGFILRDTFVQEPITNFYEGRWYLSGKGGEFYDGSIYSGFPGWIEWCNKVVYYKDDSISCGKPLNLWKFTSLPELPDENEKWFGNAYDGLLLKYQLDLVEFYTTDGKRVFSEEDLRAGEKIPFPESVRGYCIVRMIKDGEVQVEVTLAPN